MLTALLLLPTVRVPIHLWPQEYQEFSPGTQKLLLLSPCSFFSSPWDSLVFHKHSGHAPTSGPLHLLGPWSGPILPQLSSGLPPFMSLIKYYSLREALTAPSLNVTAPNNISLPPFLLYICSIMLATTGQGSYFPYLLGLVKYQLYFSCLIHCFALRA